MFRRAANTQPNETSTLGSGAGRFSNIVRTVRWYSAVGTVRRCSAVEMGMQCSAIGAVRQGSAVGAITHYVSRVFSGIIFKVSHNISALSPHFVLKMRVLGNQRYSLRLTPRSAPRCACSPLCRSYPLGKRTLLYSI